MDLAVSSRVAGLTADPVASDLPVAAVVVQTPLAHLDRVFEYAVPPDLAEQAVPGARVRVRFAGRDLEGFVVERLARAGHDGPLTPIRRVVSPEPVLTPELLRVCRAVADRYAGTLSDVLRLAIPPRHAAAEKALPGDVPTLDPVPSPAPGGWAAYRAGEALLRHLADGSAPQAAWLALPGAAPERDWPRAVALACAATLASGRGALVVVPDRRDLDRVDVEVARVLGPGRHVRLTAEQGPQARYTAWLKIRRGHVRCVLGTRAAAFAPVRDLGLLVNWDDGDDLHAEPRAPYPHVREVLAIRAREAGAARLHGGFTRSVEVAAQVAEGSLVPVQADRDAVREAAPRVLVAGEDDVARDGPAAHARLPSLVWRTAGTALRSGPVLVQVPRAGYLPGLSCEQCRAPARCPACHGPMTLEDPRADPTCGWCGTSYGPSGFRCPRCEGDRLRSSLVGVRRTAEELGRAFPGVPVVSSRSGAVVVQVPHHPALVVATPGAEPVADGGYAATVLLDAWLAADRWDLDAGVEAARRWFAAAALTRPRADGGVVVVAGVPAGVSVPAVEALVRWDPGWLADRELADRAELALPPTVRMAELVGPRRAVRDAVASMSLPGVDVLGPLPYRARPAPGTSTGPGPVAAERRVEPEGDDRVRVYLRVRLPDGPRLSAELTAIRARRSARKDPEALAVRVDPRGP